MPTRRLANSNPSRYRAQQIAKEMKDAVPPPLIIPITGNTSARLDVFYPLYKSKILSAEAALQLQFTLTGQIKDAKPLAEYLISDFYDALQRAIRRGLFNESVRTLYGLAATDTTLPTLNSEADVKFWGEKAADGETARIAAGGAPITFPSIAEVNTAVNSFKNLNVQQANAKIAFDTAQEAIAAQNPEADKLILKMWNEIETTFDEGDKASMRRKAREWGVIYVPTPGEAPSPDDYSILGRVTDSATGNPLAEAAVLLDGTPTLELTDAEGNYFIGVQPPGTYKLTIYKGLYQLKEIPGIIVTANAITTVNAALQPGGPVGNVSVSVFTGGLPANAKVSVEGIPGTYTTDALGKCTLTAVPEGPQTIRAELTSDSAIFQTQSINVLADSTVNALFNF